MAGTNILVTESFLAANFTPKDGHTPGSDNTITLDCDTIISRYYVTVQGVTSTGNRCPAQNELVPSQPFASSYLIYNYYTAVDSRNITSVGWSVPSKTTYENIISHLGGYSASLAKLKSTTSWSTPGNNSSGFNALSNGGANFNPTQTYGNGTFMLNWTTTSYSSADAWHLGIQNDSVWMEGSSIHKWIGGTLRAYRSTANSDGVLGVYYGNDGKAYQTVAIGGIEITTQDLEESKFRNGDSVPYINNGYTWYNDGNLGLPCSTYYGDLSVTTTTTTTAEPVIWYILWYNCQTSSNSSQSGPYTQSYVNSIFVYNRRWYDSVGNSYLMMNAANSSWGQSSITPSYTYNETDCPPATTTTTTTPGAGYYDCGYGCQYYSYNPGCSTCSTTTTAAPYYGYTVDVYNCGDCNLVNTGVSVQDQREFLLINRYYFDLVSGYVYKIVDSNLPPSGYISSCYGGGTTSCAGIACM